MNQKTANSEKKGRKNNIGLVGFALSIAGPLSCGLTLIPAFVCSLVGILKKSYRPFAYLGLIISTVLGLFFLVLIIPWTPPGSVPYPLSVLKFRMNAPSFWLNYDKSHLTKAHSQYWLFGGAGGALYFKANVPQAFKPPKVIAFAEKHKWYLQDKTQLTKDDFAKFLDEKGRVIWLDIASYFNDSEDEDQAEKRYQQDQQKAKLLRGMTMGDMFTLWIQESCSILSFDTGNRIGAHSYIVISNDGRQMAIYCNGIR